MTTKNIAERIKHLRTLNKLTQDKVAAEMGDKVDRVSISNWERGLYAPSHENMLELAKALKTSYEYIKYGERYSNIKSVESMTGARVPVISWDKVINWLEKMEGLTLDEKTIYLSLDRIEKGRCFGLEVIGDSMDSPHVRPNFPSGTYIIVDPDIKPEQNDFVIAISKKSNEALFRQYIKDGVNYTLRPLNSQYEKAIVDDDIKIIGVIIKYEYFIKKGA